MTLDEARAEIAKLTKLLDMDACIMAGAEQADVDQQASLRRQISEWKQNFREKHEDCNEARAIARRYRRTHRDCAAHRGKRCTMCVGFDALPWAKDDA
jgi:hypothetical protein